MDESGGGEVFLFYYISFITLMVVKLVVVCGKSDESELVMYADIV